MKVPAPGGYLLYGPLATGTPASRRRVPSAAAADLYPASPAHIRSTAADLPPAAGRGAAPWPTPHPSGAAGCGAAANLLCSAAPTAAAATSSTATAATSSTASVRYVNSVPAAPRCFVSVLQHVCGCCKGHSAISHITLINVTSKWNVLTSLCLAGHSSFRSNVSVRSDVRWQASACGVLLS